MNPPNHVQAFAIAYDLSDDRERGRVDKVLKGFGHRVQKSVFMVRLPKRSVERLRGELERLDLRSGSVLFFRLQSNVKVASVGLAFTDPGDATAYVI